MIDGVRNNRHRQVQEQEAQNNEKAVPGRTEFAVKETGRRVSVLQRLREKQAAPMRMLGWSVTVNSIGEYLARDGWILLFAFLITCLFWLFVVS